MGIQYAGRLNRDFDGKQNVIVYDYVDSHIPMFDNMYAKRLKAYKQIGYEVCTGIVGEKQTANAIYDGDNYLEVFQRDLLEATILTMRHQIVHMIKYHYLPWDSGKKTYNQNN